MSEIRRHRCHAVGCRVEVHPILLLCDKHWAMVPHSTRISVWMTYRPGQCDDKKPSLSWCLAADDAVQAVADKEGKTVGVTFAGAFYPPPGSMAAPPVQDQP